SRRHRRGRATGRGGAGGPRRRPAGGSLAGPLRAAGRRGYTDAAEATAALRRAGRGTLSCGRTGTQPACLGVCDRPGEGGASSVAGGGAGPAGGAGAAGVRPLLAHAGRGPVPQRRTGPGGRGVEAIHALPQGRRRLRVAVPGVDLPAPRRRQAGTTVVRTLA